MIDIDWLRGVAPLPATVNEALDMLDRGVASDDWLRDVLAAAGKLLVDPGPQDAVGGRVVVVKALAASHADKAREVLLRPDGLAIGARRLAHSARFNPELVGTSVDVPALGDIGWEGAHNGIVIGDDGKRALLLTDEGPGWISLARGGFRAVPYDVRPHSAQPIALDRDGQPLRDATPDLWPPQELVYG